MDFVILDDLGYLPFAQTGGQLLFHLTAGSPPRGYEASANRRSSLKGARGIHFELGVRETFAANSSGWVKTEFP
jgi:hypothetical protein